MDSTIRIRLVICTDAVFCNKEGQLIAVIHLVQRDAQALGVDLPAPFAGLQIRVFLARKQVAAGDLVILVVGGDHGHIIAKAQEIHRILPQDLFVARLHLDGNAQLPEHPSAVGRIVTTGHHVRIEIVLVVFVQNAAHHIVRVTGGRVAGKAGNHAAHHGTGNHLVAELHRQRIGHQLMVGTLEDMLRKDMEVAQKEVSRAKSELDLKDDERNALKDEMIRVIRGKSSIDRDMIQQLLDENQAAIQAAQDALTAAQNKLEEIEQENKKAENDCSNLFTWASTYQNASFQQRQAILNQFIKEVRVGRDYDIEIILNVPLEEFEEFKSHSLSVRTPSGRKTDLKQAPVRGLGTPNGGIVVFDKTSGEAMNIMPKSSAHVTLRCQDE